ncbi:MAG: hypothetical protein ACK4I8_09730, partial [Armatimonadota bacterium]
RAVFDRPRAKWTVTPRFILPRWQDIRANFQVSRDFSARQEPSPPVNRRIFGRARARPSNETNFL